MKKTTRLLSLLVALAMVASAVCVLAACQPKSDQPKSDCDTNGHTGGTATCQQRAICEVCGQEYGSLGDHVDANGDNICDVCEKSIGYWVDDSKTYSYRMGPSDLPTSWNSHTYQSSSSTYVLNYSEDALYTFDYNEAGDGYVIVPSMASADPVDVSSEYAGQFDIKSGDTGKAYKITLKTSLKFDNGEAITANTFVESMQLLLNPDAANYRADNVYKSGNLKIYGAENYVKQGSYDYSEIVSENYGDDEYINPSSFTVTSDGYLQYDGKDICVNIYDGGNWGSYGLATYAAYGYLATGAEIDETTGRYKVYSADGEWILTRSIEADTEIGDYLFYDLEGNLLQQRYVNEAGDAWVYLDKDGNVVEAWAGCSIQYVSQYYEPLEAAADEDGYVKLTSELLLDLQNCIAMLHGYDNVAAYAAEGGDYAYMEFEEMAMFGQNYDSYSWEDVGFFAADDYTLVIVLKNAMDLNFYLRYELCTNFFLVNPTLYKKCIDTSSGVYTCSYGTSVDTYVGFGPYKLTTYVQDSKMELTRNEYWHGYYEEDLEGQYQTNHIVYTKVTSDATRLEMFLKGELDSYSLQSKDMADYINSDYLYYTNSESTWYLALNPDYNTLKDNQETATPETAGNKVIKTILDITEFRQALSYSLDRNAMNLELNPTGGVAVALLSDQIVGDPESGLFYRATDEAKDAILEFWGLSDQWGEGKKYATRDEAIASITGYDPTGAKTLFASAYATAVSEGYFSEAGIDPDSDNWELQICIGIPSEGDFYSNGYEYLKKCWTSAVEGTPFEGHISFVKSQVLGSTSFGEYLRNGSVDLLFYVGYSGSQFDPYSMMDCFTGSLQYDPFTDKDEIDLDIEINGQTLRASLYAWVSECLQGDKITASVIGSDGNPTGETVSISAGASDDQSIRVHILAKCEAKIMSLANIFPLSTDSSASLKGMRIIYKTEEYILGLGRGGIAYYTYAMDDDEWAAYVKEQGGTLNYK